MKNKLTDLNNYLFEQIERINDDSLSSDQLDSAIKRAESIGKLANNIVANSRLQLDAIELAAEYGADVSKHIPDMLLGGINNTKQLGGH